MKKTLAALIVTAFAASAANAAVVYDNEGTKVELNGSLRLILEKADAKKYDAVGNSTKTANSATSNFIEIAKILIDFLPLCDVSYNEGGD